MCFFNEVEKKVPIQKVIIKRNRERKSLNFNEQTPKKHKEKNSNRKKKREKNTVHIKSKIFDLMVSAS